jgi:hypothetical protein
MLPPFVQPLNPDRRPARVGYVLARGEIALHVWPEGGEDALVTLEWQGMPLSTWLAPFVAVDPTPWSAADRDGLFGHYLASRPWRYAA